MPLVTLSQALEQVIEEVSERTMNGGVNTIGIPTGFYKLDEATGGLRNDFLYIFGGRPGMGKTAFALTLAMNVAEMDKKVLFLSLEMSANLLALRLLSARTNIAALDIEYGRLSKDQLQKVQAVRDQVKNISFDLYDDSMRSDLLVTKTKEYQDRKGLDLLVVDYVSLLRDPTSYGETERVSRIVGNLREIARACNIPVLALAQLNREVEKREGNLPTLSDFRDSGAIEQDAGLAGFVFRPHYYAMLHEGAEEQEVEHDSKLIIAKNRQGPTGAINLRFIPKQMRWEGDRPTPKAPPPTQSGSLVAKVREKR